MKKRVLFHSIIKQLDHKNALVITGLRQVGKTTLMKQIFDSTDSKSKLWFDLGNPLDVKIFEDIDYNNIFHRLSEMTNNKKERIFVFIDEIQNFPEITKVIKYLIDHYSVKFVVTGSSSFYLKNLFPESLSGRKFLYQLPPLSFREFLYFNDEITAKEATVNDLSKALLPKHISEYKKFEHFYRSFTKYGGFPEVVVTKDAETKLMILKNIFASFFEKDLKILSDYKNIRELRDLILLLVPRVGSMLDVSRLASELGIDRVKTYNYLEFLKGIFFIHLLPKFSNNIDRTVAGGKKVYFCDTGILNLIGKVNEGQLFENAVINQLFQYGSLSFYYKKNIAEIDAILDNKYAFEMKLTGNADDIEVLRRRAGKINISESFIISLNYKNNTDFVYPLFL